MTASASIRASAMLSLGGRAWTPRGRYVSSPSVPDEEGQVGGHVRLPAFGVGPDGAHGAAAVRAVQDVHRVRRQPRRVPHQVQREPEVCSLHTEPNNPKVM